MRPLKTLERVISKAGLGSRTEARRWIHQRRVSVNGEVVENPDTWLDMERDVVLFDGKPLERRERVYILLYKPTGYITTYKDPEGRPPSTSSSRTSTRSSHRLDGSTSTRRACWW